MRSRLRRGGRWDGEDEVVRMGQTKGRAGRMTDDGWSGMDNGAEANERGWMGGWTVGWTTGMGPNGREQRPNNREQGPDDMEWGVDSREHGLDDGKRGRTTRNGGN